MTKHQLEQILAYIAHCTGPYSVYSGKVCMCSCFLFPKHIQYLNDILETPMTTSGHCIYILRRYIYFFEHS